MNEPLLERCRARAAEYDRENRFFQEDFDELKAAGYLLMAVPRELGGMGFNLAQVARETRRLAARDLSGGFGMFKKSELERLFRDARAGRFHPANPLLTSATSPLESVPTSSRDGGNLNCKL